MHSGHLKRILPHLGILISQLVLISCGWQTWFQHEVTDISVQKLQEMIEEESKPVLLDVRTQVEYNGSLGKLEVSILLPLSELKSRYEELLPYKEKLIVIYCRSGNRSRTAAKFLMGKDFEVVNLKGGIKAWNLLHGL